MFKQVHFFIKIIQMQRENRYLQYLGKTGKEVNDCII